jgi:polyisoprenoid-binding protein YceI
MKKTIFLLVALLVCVSTAQAQVILAKSSLTAIGTQLGTPMTGDFKKFSAVINFDPVKPAESKASLEIAMNSYDLGDDLYNKEVAGKNFFDAVKFPAANFVTTAIKPAGPGKFEFAGKLTMKAKTQPVTAIVTYKKDGANQIFDGQVPIKRLAFGVGEGEWGDVSLVEDQVMIKFHIVNAVASAGSASAPAAKAEPAKKAVKK